MAHGWRRTKPKGSMQSRGYGAEHAKLRREWKVKVDRGEVSCARCGEWIAPTSKWHLDHNDDRTGYLGPSHVRCNLSAAAYKAKAIQEHAGPTRRATLDRAASRRYSRTW